MRAVPGNGNTPMYVLDIGQEVYNFYNLVVLPIVEWLWLEHRVCFDEIAYNVKGVRQDAVTFAQQQLFMEVMRQLTSRLCGNIELYQAELAKLPYFDYLVGGRDIMDNAEMCALMKEGVKSLGMAYWIVARAAGIKLGEVDDYVLETAQLDYQVIIKLEDEPPPAPLQGVNHGV